MQRFVVDCRAVYFYRFHSYWKYSISKLLPLAYFSNKDTVHATVSSNGISSPNAFICICNLRVSNVSFVRSSSLVGDPIPPTASRYNGNPATFSSPLPIPSNFSFSSPTPHVMVSPTILSASKPNLSNRRECLSDRHPYP